MMNYLIRRFVLLLVLWLSLGEMAAYAQTQTIESKTVTLSLKQAKLAKILKAIQDKSSVQIVFNGQVVDKIPAQNVEAKKEKLTTLLNRILNNTGLGYIIRDNVIIIQVRPATVTVNATLGAAVFGKVRSETGEPMALVTVTNLQTGSNTLTDRGGNFILNAEVNDRIQFRHLGYKPHQETVRDFKGFQVNLSRAESSIDEVVLTGYQEIQKKLLTGSIYTVKGVDIAQPNVPNIASMLQGKIPGLAVETISGSPNSVPRMRIRGTSTLIGNANPIWVVDGIVKENTSAMNPDNPMGLNPSTLDKILRTGITQASADLIGNSISGINIHDIESISFLKDAAATALYGTNASNGVILLTTKKGKAGPARVSYSGSFGVIQKPSYGQMQLMNSQQRITLSKEMRDAGLLHQSLPFEYGYEGYYWQLINHKITESEFNEQVRKLEMQNTDWFDILFRNGLTQSHHVSLSGGSDKNTFRSSISYADNPGAAKGDGQKSISGTINANSRFGNKINTSFSLQASHRSSVGILGINPMEYAIRTSRTINPELFYPTQYPKYGGIENQNPLKFNALNEIKESGSWTKNTGIDANLNFVYNILSGLRFNSAFGGTISGSTEEQYYTERSFEVASNRGYDYGSVVPGSPEEDMSPLPFGGILNNQSLNLYTISWRNKLNYTLRVFNRDRIAFDLGQEIRSVGRQGYSQYQHGYLKDRGESFATDPDYYYVFKPKKTDRVSNTVSFYGAGSYAFRERYVIDGSLRIEASNRFGQYTNRRFLPIWSVSGRWNVTDEPWLKDNWWVNSLDIRGSYGAQGKVVEEVGPDLVAAIPEYQSVHPLAKEYVLKLQTLAYPDLQWQRTIGTNVGIGANLLNSFLTFNVEYYDKKTKNAITQLDVPTEYGVARMLINGGTVANKGWDINLQFNILRNTDWDWTIGGNYSINDNKLSKAADRDYLLSDYLNGTVQLPDEPIETFFVFGFKGLSAENGMPLFKTIDEVEKPEELNFRDYLVKAGLKHHNLTGGFNTNLSYRNVSLTADFAYGLGAYRLRNPLYKGENMQHVPSTDQNMPVILIDRWRKPGDEQFTNIPALVDFRQGQHVRFGSENMSRYQMYDASDILLSKANFLKCTSLGLAYKVPAKWSKRMRLSGASLGLQVSNVFRITSKEWAGQDPEIGGVGTTALPQVPMYSFSFNVSL